MVAYSFKAQFVEPIIDGTKRQTVRADRRRHARPGEELQLYTGMRTRHCKLIGRAECFVVSSIVLTFGTKPSVSIGHTSAVYRSDLLDLFAKADGFRAWTELRDFWRANHPGVEEFHGVLITWRDLRV